MRYPYDDPSVPYPPEGDQTPINRSFAAAQDDSREPYRPEGDQTPINRSFAAAQDDSREPYPPEGDQTPINSQPTVQEAPVYPHGFQQNTPWPPPSNRRSSGGLRTGAIIVLTLVLAIIFGTGLFAGWEYGRGTTSTPAANGSSTGVLEPGTKPTTTVPALTGNNIEAVREAVIAKVRPAQPMRFAQQQHYGFFGNSTW